jgi:hypothetical protein
MEMLEEYHVRRLAGRLLLSQVAKWLFSTYEGLSM